MTLLNRQWQSVSGTRHVRIYPYLRKPDILSSNTFLIETPEQITLIDPGAMEDQSREIETIVRNLILEKPRPVLIYLTTAKYRFYARGKTSRIPYARRSGTRLPDVSGCVVWNCPSRDSTCDCVQDNSQRHSPTVSSRSGLSELQFKVKL